MELYYGIRTRNYTMESNHSSRLRNHLIEFNYGIIWWNYITELHGIPRRRTLPYLNKFTAPEALDRCIRIRAWQRIFLATVAAALVWPFHWALVGPLATERSEMYSKRSAEVRDCNLHITHSEGCP